MTLPLETTPLAFVAEPTPEAAGYGLYSVASVLDPDDSHVQSGVMWEPSVCGIAGAFPVNCPQTAGFPLPVTDGIPLVQAFPFGVSAGQSCKLVGVPVERLQALARARLRFTEQRAVESGYATGSVFTGGVVSPHLQDAANATILAAAPVKPAIALGLLEEALGDMTGAVGVIHAPRVAFNTLKFSVADERGTMRTELGTKVAFGTGYRGAGPDGTGRAADLSKVWLYATGPVQVVRGPVLDLPGDPRDALDRSTNVAKVQAVRIVSVGHSCGLVAVPMTLT